MLKRFLFPTNPNGVFISVILLVVRIVFGILMMNHGIDKWANYQELSTVFPDPLGIGSPLSLGLAIFGELACSMAFIIGFLYRLAMIPMIFTMCVAFFIVHGNDPFAVKELAFVYLVDEAIAGFKGTASVADMQAFDYWCNGDIALWKKVANQLKLRLAMRIVKVNPTLAKQKAEEAVQGGVLTSADRDILINQGLSNELTRMFEWGDCGMNASLITMLEGFKDPRLPLYVTKNQAAVTCEDGSTIEEGTKYLGVRGGCNLPSKPNQWGNFSKVICTYTTAFPVMKVAEGYFLRAEGALRGWSMGGSAKDLYEEGIRISIKNELAYKGSIAGVTSISDAEIDAYLNGTSGQIDFVDPVKAENSIKAMNTLGVKWDEGASKEEKLQRIITQKWIALYPDGPEGWSEYRRTGYPELIPVVVNGSNGTIDTELQVRRLPYTRDEKINNPDGVASGIAALGGADNGGTKLWWDKRDR